ncbi:hypothetical protein [Cetobacterium sp. SF1]|uniref:hypothetical protein n=1 Tax=Cetobacterium sp. SF1 TaxID=3417654 RepID=UPI003CFB5E31
MNIELQIQLAKQIWDEVEGNPNSMYIYISRNLTKEEHLAIEDLLKKGVIKRNNHFLSINSQTKFFLENNGKTKLEIKDDQERKRKEKEIELSKEANSISKKSMLISGLALIISIISLCITLVKK